MQGIASEVDLQTAEGSRNPLLVIGDDRHVSAVLEALGIGMPAELEKDGATLRAWVARRRGGTEVLIVSARDERSLAAASGPLRYYGRRGYVLFEGRKPLLSGDWGTADGHLVRRLH